MLRRRKKNSLLNLLNSFKPFKMQNKIMITSLVKEN